MKKLFYWVCLLSLAVSAKADESLTFDQARPLVEKIQQGMSSLRSIALDFTQERHLSLFVDPLKSTGVMFIEKPDRIRWETTAPYQSILLGDHKSVAQFEKTDGQWKKLNLGFPQMLQRVMEQMTLLHQGKLDALTSDYTMSVTTGSVSAVVLVPKDPNVRSLLADLQMVMAPDFTTVREVVMKEPNGDFTRIIMTRERRDVTFPAGTFDQTRPLDLAAVEAALNHAP